MIHSITFENYKSFKAKTKLDLKPITVLVGTNSSGKSSIIKLLGLLNQSYTNPRSDTFLTYDGPVVDMGDFKTISYQNLGEPITIELMKDASNRGFDTFILLINARNNARNEIFLYHRYRERTSSIAFLIIKSRTIVGSSVDNQIIVNQRPIRHSLGILNPDDYLESIKSALSRHINNLIKIFEIGYGRKVVEQEITEIIKNNLIERYIVSVDGLRFSKIRFDSVQDLAIPQMPLSGQDETITELPESLYYAINKYKFSDIRRHDDRPIPEKLLEVISDEVNVPYRHLLVQEAWNYIADQVEYICIDEIFDRDEDTGISSLIEEFQGSIEKSLGIMRMIGPLRSIPRRFYTETQLKDLIFGMGAIDDLSESKLEELAKAVSQDLNLLGADYDVNIPKIVQSPFIPDLYALTLTDKKSGTTHSYSDVGFGLSQIIPILITLRSYQIYSRPESFVIIEQPELHLHPAPQARLADIFVDWLHDSPPNKNWAQLLLETHSEHLVRGFQVLVARGKLSKDEIAIYYVDKDDKGNSFVKLMPLNENGAFTETWPEGFFDQAYLQAMELLTAQED